MTASCPILIYGVMTESKSLVPCIAVIIGIMIGWFSASQEIEVPIPDDTNKTLTAQNSGDSHEMRLRWIESVIRESDTIKVGMTRNDLLKVFKKEGGISDPESRTYAYHNNSYIKVDVKFKTINKDPRSLTENAEDVITHISAPYLQLSIAD